MALGDEAGEFGQFDCGESKSRKDWYVSSLMVLWREA